MNKSITAIVLRTENYRDYDKRLKLFTEDGEVITVIMRGVKKPGAKMKFAAQPFSFCNFELSGSGNNATIVSGAAVIDDLSRVTDFLLYNAGCVMLETAEKACSVQPNRDLFVILLKRLKDLIYSDYPPLIPVISYIQNAIHKSGYAYTYAAPKSNPSTMMELLACTENMSCPFVAEEKLINRTFFKIAERFEDKFSCKLVSKDFVQ